MKPSTFGRGESALSFGQTLAIGAGGYRERSRYAERYGERYGDRYGVGQSSAVGGNGGPMLSATPGTNGNGCFNVSTGRIEGGKMHGITPHPSTVKVQGSIAYIFAGDVQFQLPTCGNGGGGGNGGNGKPGTPGCDPCDWQTSRWAAGHGRPFKEYAHGYKCAIRPPRCECHVIGGNTLNSTVFPGGILSGTFGFIDLDSGDASFFVPHYLHIVAFEVGETASLEITGLPLLVLMTNSLSGREPNMRRASETNPAFGVATTTYGEEKELECVDWHRFASVNNQQLRITFFNPNAVAVHVFGDLWGLPTA